MSFNSNIEWTDATWNPVKGVHQDKPRLQALLRPKHLPNVSAEYRGHPYEQGFDLRLVPEKLAEPLRWRKPKSHLRQFHERPFS